MRQWLRASRSWLLFRKASLRSLRVRQVGFAIALGAAVAAVFASVNLEPQVDQSLFFSADDPEIQEQARIETLFLTQPQIFVSARGTAGITRDYISMLRRASRDIRKIEGVTSVRDILHGPESVKEAFQNPLWRRLLIAPDKKASNFIIMLEPGAQTEVVAALDAVVQKHSRGDFILAVSGAPYIAEQMKRQVTRDLKVFGLAAVLVFSVVIALIYRSIWILAGMVIAAGLAAALTMLGRAALGLQVDLLTPNITTVVFVLTILHMVFLANHWSEADGGTETDRPMDPSEGRAAARVNEALRKTFGPSFWAMLTTALGFSSLLFAPAKPARNLGMSGAIGTLLAFGCAFVVFPAFLYAGRRHTGLGARIHDRCVSFFKKKHVAWAAGVLVIAAISAGGLFRLNTDPQLFSYFDGDVRDALEEIDRSGGSSPLELVIRSREGKLGNDEAFKRMWALQRSLEKDPAVGSVVSLPVLMAEAEEQTFFSFLLSWDFILDKMEEPENGRIAQSFLTRDHGTGRFILRMEEGALAGDTSRREAIARVKQAARDHGFVPALSGGMFALQAKMADLVSSSLLSGIIGLFILFSIVAFVASRSFAVSIAMVISFITIPLVLLGVFGYFRIPLDVIALPAANVALAIGVDDMVHLVFEVRKRGEGGVRSWQRWVEARGSLWRPILSSSLIVTLGFALLLLSGFPPTRRMGLAILVGTFTAFVVVLIVFPWLAQRLVTLLGVRRIINLSKAKSA